jgi:non-specific serine/threonine protein kinase
VGRERELAEVRRLLAEHRLVTLTGTGGCGKTRLALQAVARPAGALPGGVLLVELAALGDPSLVPRAVAAALGVPEQPGRAPADVVVAALRPRQLLLLLDNCEHLAATCAALADAVLRACPGVRVLATSRQALGVAGELAWPVPSLRAPEAAAPATPERLLRYDAIRLFVERARLARPGYALTAANAPAVARVCRRLDGLPLALELAAARVRVLSAEQLAERLDDRFRLLTGGGRLAPARHQTLRAAVDWSHALLSESARRLFARLSVFAGGFSLGAAEAVCAGDGLERGEVLDRLTELVERSLVLAEGDGEVTHFRLLETLREYAHERLAASREAAGRRRRHASYFADLAEAAEPALRGAPDQAAWLDRLEREQDNLRAALQWSCAAGGAAAAGTGARLAGALARFWAVRGHVGEGRRWLEALLARGARVPPPVRAKALWAAGFLAGPHQGDAAAARPWLEAALALFRQTGDRWGCAEALRHLGGVLRQLGDPAGARARLEESLALYRGLGDRWGAAWALSYLGGVELGEADRRGAAGAPAALARYAESAALLQELGDQRGTAWALSHLAHTVARDGELERAAALHAESIALFRGLGEQQGIAACLYGLAGVAGARGEHGRAARLCGAGDALAAAAGTPGGAAPFPAQRAVYERVQEAARAALGGAAFAAARAAGRALALDQAIDTAGGPAPPTAPPAQQGGKPVRRRRTTLPDGLTLREQEVLRLIALGRSNRQIASDLVLSVRTVEKHVAGIYAKTGTRGRVAAAAHAPRPAQPTAGSATPAG